MEELLAAPQGPHCQPRLSSGAKIMTLDLNPICLRTCLPAILARGLGAASGLATRCPAGLPKHRHGLWAAFGRPLHCFPQSPSPDAGVPCHPSVSPSPTWSEQKSGGSLPLSLPERSPSPHAEPQPSPSPRLPQALYRHVPPVSGGGPCPLPRPAGLAASLPNHSSLLLPSLLCWALPDVVLGCNSARSFLGKGYSFRSLR